MVCHISFRDVIFTPSYTGVRVQVWTDVPSHLFLRLSTTEPQTHKHSTTKRGLSQMEDYYYCFVAYEDNEQYEAGDTVVHTWWKPGWPVCTTKWGYFWGSVAGEVCVSTSPVFKYHNNGVAPVPPPDWTYEESQLLYNSSIIVSAGTGATKGQCQGQRLTVTGRKITQLRFVLSKVGSPNWVHSFRIYRVSDGALLAQTPNMNDTILTTSPAWYTNTLITPWTSTGVAVRIVVFHTAGVGTVTVIKAHYQNTDVKANEFRTRYENGSGPWYDYSNQDFAYAYVYQIVPD